MTSSEVLASLLANMAAKKIAPKNIELSAAGDVFLACAFDSPDSKIISGKVYCGAHRDANVSAVKAAVEMLEYRAFQYGHKQKNPACLTKSSDGFAAYPAILKNAKQIARQNALCEATERFVWAFWWDNIKIGHKMVHYRNLKGIKSKACASIFNYLNSVLPIEEIVEVYPHYKDENGNFVVIFFAFLLNGGVVTGGACGARTDKEHTYMRAATELLRHGMATYQMLEKNLKPTTFYERRLAYFAIKKSVKKNVWVRLNSKRKNVLKLPRLEFDLEIKHEHEDLVKVYRCLYENQPVFMGGKISRLCI